MHADKIPIPPLARLKTEYRLGKKRGEVVGRHIRKVCTPKRLALVGCGGLLLIWVIVAVTFYWPRTILFSYSGKTCVSAPTLLPSLATGQSSTSLDIEPAHTISVGSLPIYASSACITLRQPPKERSSEKISLAMPGNPLMKKIITVQTGTYPKLAGHTIATKPISTKDKLALRLAQADRIFSYYVAANGKHAPCSVRDKNLSCDIPALALAQATPYDVAVYRTLSGKDAGMLVGQQVSTVEPVQVAATSITAGQLVYDMPVSLTIRLNKAVTDIKDVRLENRSVTPAQSLPIDVHLDGDTISLAFKEPLPRSAGLALVIPSLEATDGGYLNSPFELPFTTSGGPKVKGINIGSAKVQPGSTIVLTFDTGLAAGQNLADFIHLEGGSVASITAQGNRVTIKPGSMGRCVPFTVKVFDGIKNEYGVAGGSAWQFSSRTICQTVFSIGSSVESRGITAYSFGTGPSKIVFVGGTHGDEKSSVQILTRWIDQLELNPNRIPAHQTIVVIPNLNPDGYAANRRTNANGVDLNRNFPSNSWKSGVTMPDKSYWPNGGGTAPLSEPESRALANYITAQAPRLVLTYHAAGDIVQPNGGGDSTPIASEYAKKSTVGYLGASQTGTFFEYDTTGAFEDWLNDKYGWPALLIELKSRTSNDYSGHQNALWYIAGL